MPIVVPSVLAAPLSQGDILAGIRLFATAACWQAASGEPEKAPYNLCMVISRPCVLAHKPQVLVAGVEKYPHDPPKDLNFAQAKSFLTKLRDGHGNPDLFYLGHLPEKKGRYCVRFDSLHTIELPKDAADKQVFLGMRVATLTPDFYRDLHSRLFGSFCSMGFDDLDWYSDEDMNWIGKLAETEVNESKVRVGKIEGKKAGLESGGKQFGDKELKDAKAAHQLVMDDAGPFAAEWNKRNAGNNPE